MNVGILVYSQTGNTLSVAEKLAERLKENNHTVTTETIQTLENKKDNEKNSRKIDALAAVPDISDFDVLVLASPVHAFSLAPAMGTCLKSLPSLKGKRVALLMTQHFPYPWMGGQRAMNQFKKLSKEKGAEILADGIINWSQKKRQEQVQILINRMAKVLEN